MPQINLIPEVLYEPNHPYHYIYDNLPLKNILARISLVNIQTDTNAEMLRGAAGSAGSIGGRLGSSLKEDGSLKDSAVDACGHNIAYHRDGEKDGVEYVRMLADERSKLSLIGSEANLLTMQVDDRPPLTDGNVEFKSSSTIFFELQAPNVVKAHSNFPPDLAHRHEYGVAPLADGSPKKFKTPANVRYVEGSLRVYINGVRIGPNVRVPIFSSTSAPLCTGTQTACVTAIANRLSLQPVSWVLFSISSQDAAAGTFELNTDIQEPGYNSIFIDYDRIIPPATSSSSSSSSSS
jgi:hypothetical protein